MLIRFKRVGIRFGLKKIFIFKNKNMKVIIIEDEKPAARQLQRMLSEFPDLEIAAVIHSVEEGVEWFKTHEHPQLIFSDIVLGDGLSFDIFEQKEAFEQMLKISGVGPKTAFQIVQIPVEELARAIEQLDTKLFQSIPGIGPKLAKKIILELK